MLTVCCRVMISSCLLWTASSCSALPWSRRSSYLNSRIYYSNHKVVIRINLANWEGYILSFFLCGSCFRTGLSKRTHFICFIPYISKVIGFWPGWNLLIESGWYWSFVIWAEWKLLLVFKPNENYWLKLTSLASPPSVSVSLLNFQWSPDYHNENGESIRHHCQESWGFDCTSTWAYQEQRKQSFLVYIAERFLECKWIVACATAMPAPSALPVIKIILMIITLWRW